MNDLEIKYFKENSRTFGPMPSKTSWPVQGGHLSMKSGQLKCLKGLNLCKPK